MAAARRRRFSLADYAAAHRQDTFQFNKSRRRNNLNLTLPEQAANEAAARRKSQAAVEAAAVGRNADVHQEAIEAFSVVAALVLGFSFSALVAVACELTNELRMGNAYVAVFCVMMAVSTALSGYSAVFFTMEVYYVKRLADEGGADQQLRLETFLTLVGYRRKLARNTTVIALALDMVAIGILIFGFLPLGVGIVVLVCLSCGSVLVVLIMVQMRQLTAYCLGLGSHEEDSITSTSTHLRGDQLRRGVDMETVVHRHSLASSSPGSPGHRRTSVESESSSSVGTRRGSLSIRRNRMNRLWSTALGRRVVTMGTERIVPASANAPAAVPARPAPIGNIVPIDHTREDSQAR